MVVFRLSSLLALIALGACTEADPVVDKRAVVSHALATTAQLFVEREGGVRRAGSAVILATDAPDGETVILTTAHLLEPPVQQTVTVFDEAQQTHLPATVAAVDAELDLALVTADLNGVSDVTLAAGADLADDVLVVAFPWGRQRTVVNGAVSQVSPLDPEHEPRPIRGAVRLIDASVSYGMSGGGVFERATGDLVGLVRGYRTAHLSLTSEPAPLKLPIAGETTVIPAVDIACFLTSHGFGQHVPEPFLLDAGALPCESPK